MIHFVLTYCTLLQSMYDLKVTTDEHLTFRNVSVDKKSDIKLIYYYYIAILGNISLCANQFCCIELMVLNSNYENLLTVCK